MAQSHIDIIDNDAGVIQAEIGVETTQTRRGANRIVDGGGTGMTVTAKGIHAGQ